MVEHPIDRDGSIGRRVRVPHGKPAAASPTILHARFDDELELLVRRFRHRPGYRGHVHRRLGHFF
jgi:hypothetical protein